MAPEWILVGRAGRPHGTRGELPVRVLTDREERFAEGSELFTSGPGAGEKRSVRVRSSRHTGKGLLVVFDGHETRELARDMSGSEFFIPGSEIAPAEEGAFYGYQLQGCQVFAGPSEVGTVLSLQHSVANAYLVVEKQGDGAELCIPFVKDVVISIDIDNRRVEIRENFLE